MRIPVNWDIATPERVVQCLRDAAEGTAPGNEIEFRMGVLFLVAAEKLERAARGEGRESYKLTLADWITVVELAEAKTGGSL